MSNYLSAGAGAASTALSAQGYVTAGQAALYRGQAQQQEQNYSADVLDQGAGQQVAQTSAQMADTARSTDLLESTIRARAAASGGGAADPTVVSLEQGVAGRGEYNSLSLLYSGREKAAGMENQAALDRYMGTQSATAGQLQQLEEQTKAASSVLQGGSSLFSKFGNGGFKNPFTSGGGDGLPDPASSFGSDPSSIPDSSTASSLYGGSGALSSISGDGASSAFDLGSSDIGGFF